jgi:TIR domain
MTIFLSYSSDNKKLVRDFKSGLPEFIRPWLDKDELTWGDDFKKKLQEAIQSDVTFLIVFIDDGALESEWVKQELFWALAREKELSRTFVLPIVLPGTSLKRLPPALKRRQFIQYSGRARRRSTASSRAEADGTELARLASEQLFHLVTNTLTDLYKKRAFRPTTFPFLQGDWHECHFIYRGGAAQLVREQWHIRKHEVKSKSNSGLKYKGEIGEDDWTLVALLEGVGHREVVISRFYKPMPSPNVTARGMWFAVDHDKNIACGPQIVTRHALDDDSARHLLRTSLKRHSTVPLMNLVP